MQQWMAAVFLTLFGIGSVYVQLSLTDTIFLNNNNNITDNIPFTDDPSSSVIRASSSLLSTTTTTKAAEEEETKRLPTTIDILSVGSLTRPSFQDAQEQTFGSSSHYHSAVRHFYRVTETNDTETNCHSTLKLHHVQGVTRFCKGPTPKVFPTLKKMTVNYARFAWLQQKANPVGWLCAQKRPQEGFMQLLATQYNNTNSNNNHNSLLQQLPDYLIITDDDTWLNMPKLQQHLRQLYPPNTIPYAVAGCMIRSRVQEHNFTIPFGGWGMIYNRAALENWIRPIYCDDNITNNTIPKDQNDFIQMACWRLAQNEVGEQPLFRPGMSVAQLMHKYVTNWPYRQVFSTWPQQKRGYCMHSDWAWGYFTNYYHIAVHSGVLPDVPEDRLVGYNSSYLYAGAPNPKNQALRRECLHKGDDQCTADSTICHYVTPEHMYRLHRSQSSNSNSNNANNR